MNYIRHLNTFFRHVSQDNRFTSGHVSLYSALFNQWNIDHFRSPIITNRQQLMSVSAIGSKNTYIKCLKDLHSFGYIIYQPGNIKFKRSKVWILPLKEEIFMLENPEVDHIPVPDLNHNVPSFGISPKYDHPKISTGSVSNLTHNVPKVDSAMVPNVGTIYKQTNNINIEREENPQKNNFKKNEFLKKANVLPPVPNKGQHNIENPSEEKVIQYFKSKQYPELEAKKFFHYYQGTGWQTGSKKQITDWQSFAHKWVLNNFQSTNSKSITTKNYLHLPKIDNYDEPF